MADSTKDKNSDLLKELISSVQKKNDINKTKDAVKSKQARVIGVDNETYKVVVYFLDDIEQREYTFYNKTGEIINTGDTVKVFYTSNPAKGWIAKRNGEPNIKETTVYGGEGVGRPSPWDNTSEYFNCYNINSYNNIPYNVAGKQGEIEYYATAKGYATKAEAKYSHAVGLNTSITGNSEGSCGEGENCSIINSMYSHVEGYNSSIRSNSEKPNYSEYLKANHAEGTTTIINSEMCHVEGLDCRIEGGIACHAEGKGTSITLSSDRKESEANHAEGAYNNTQDSYCCHTEGYGHAITDCQRCHVEGYVNTLKNSTNTHIEGYNPGSFDNLMNCHIEGETNKMGATQACHIEGRNNNIKKDDSILLACHAEGYSTNAVENYSHSEGYSTTASGEGSHSEGENNVASGIASHAEGRNTTASGAGAHAEGGYGSTAEGESSHAENFATHAIGNYSHAGGLNSTANGVGDFVHGNDLQTSNAGSYQTVFGKFNLIDNTGNTIFAIGNGESNSSRSNAFSIDKEGNVYCNSINSISAASTVFTPYTIEQAIASAKSVFASVMEG